jgi:hypothetical protein
MGASKLVQVVTSLSWIPDVIELNLRRNIDKPDWCFRGFVQSLPENSGIIF